MSDIIEVIATNEEVMEAMSSGKSTYEEFFGPSKFNWIKHGPFKIKKGTSKKRRRDKAFRNEIYQKNKAISDIFSKKIKEFVDRDIFGLLMKSVEGYGVTVKVDENGKPNWEEALND